MNGENDANGLEVSGENDRGCRASLSRRSFIGMGAGLAGALMLQQVSDGLLMPFGIKRAYAADALGSCDILVVSVHEMGFVAVDVGNGNAPLKGVKITVTSRYNSQTVTGITGVDGAVIFDIKDLAESRGDESSPYAFNGCIVATLDGYRLFETKLVRITGASGIVVPTRSLASSADTYFELLSFDEWDIQYFANTFVTTKKNADVHTISLRLRAPQGSSGTVAMYIDDKTTPLATSAFSAVNGTAEASFAGKYLEKDTSSAIPAGSRLFMEIEMDDKRYRMESSFAVVDGPVDEPTDGKHNVLPFDFDMTSGAFKIKLPEIPKIGGSTFEMWSPSIPFLFKVTPQGYTLLGLTTPDMGFSLDTGGKDGSKWKQAPLSSYGQQWQEKKEKWERSFNQLKNAEKAALDKTDDTSLFSHTKFTPELEFKFGLQAFATLEYQWSKNDWAGSVNVILQATMRLTLTEEYIFYIFPAFVSFDFTLGMQAALGLAASKMSLDPFDMKLDRAKTAVGFTFIIGAALTLGVGAKGLASAGVRGSVSLTFYVGLQVKEPCPHLALGASAAVEVVLQFLLFKWSCKIVGKNWPALYDNWKTSDAISSTGELLDEPSPFALVKNADGGVGVGGFPLADDILSMVPGSPDAWQAMSEQGVLVTESELSKTNEFSFTKKSGAVSATAVTTSRFEKNNGITQLVVESEDGVDLAEHEAVYVGSVINAACPGQARVAGFGAQGGIKPSVDVLVSDKMFSNPRAKVVSYGNALYQFRIAAVQYGEKFRTNLIVEKLSIGGDGDHWEKKAISFSSDLAGVNREDMFDYEFDVVADSRITDAGGTEDDARLQKPGFFIVLVSGLRENGDDSTLVEVTTNPLVTFLQLDGNLAVINRHVWNDFKSLIPSTSTPTGETVYHSYSCPRIAEQTNHGSTYFHMAFLHRYSTAADKVMTTDADVVFESAAVYTYYYTEGKKKKTYNCIAFAGTANEKIDPATYDIVEMSLAQTATTEPEIYGISFAIASLASTSCSVHTVTFNEYSAKPVSAVRNVNTADSIKTLTPWPNHEGFLVVTKGETTDGEGNAREVDVLQCATFDRTVVDASAFSYENVGPDDSSITSFAVDGDGNYLFFCQNQVGKVGQEYQEDGEVIDLRGESYRIMAAKEVGGRFSSAFSFAELSHPVDNLVAFPFGSTASAFLATCYVDMSASEANHYFINVPHVACATPLYLASQNPFVCAGASAPFVVTVRNDGNMVLRGFKVTLHDEKGNEISSGQVSMSAEYLQRSIWTQDVEAVRQRAAASSEVVAAAIGGTGASPLADPAAADILIPGDIQAYVVNFDIPVDWADKRTVSVSFSDYTVDPMDMSNIGTGETLLAYATDAESRPRLELDVRASETLDLSKLHDGAMTLVGDDGSDGNGGESDASESGSKSTLATGDGLGASLAALALGAVGAGALAYSARRASLERGAEDDPE